MQARFQTTKMAATDAHQSFGGAVMAVASNLCSGFILKNKQMTASKVLDAVGLEEKNVFAVE